MSSTVVELLLWLKLLSDSVKTITEMIELAGGELTDEQLSLIKSKRQEAVSGWNNLAPESNAVREETNETPPA